MMRMTAANPEFRRGCQVCNLSKVFEFKITVSLCQVCSGQNGGFDLGLDTATSRLYS